MRCPDCNKFASFDTETDPEINVEVAEDGQITGDVRIVNTCAECSTELKEATLDVDDDGIASQLEDHRAAMVAAKLAEIESSGGAIAQRTAEAVRIEVEDEHKIESGDSDSGQRTDRFETKTRTGKPIKNPRYQKHLYGFEAEVTATCSCGESFTTTIAGEVAGSGMEEMV